MFFSKKPDGKLSLAMLSLEAFLVILSVLLALGLNSWRESRANQELAVRALNSLANEFSLNCSRINSFQSYHKEVASGERESEGLQIGLIQNSAWDAARSTGATAFINYETASVIEQIYVAQGDHRTLFQSYIQVLLSKVATEETLEQVHGQLDLVTIRELVRIQESLLEYYSELENLLESNYKNDVPIDTFCN
ncbi:MAG TPA: hypothetical protein VKM36_04755 [Balneolaceae bacterium]|nr:hypothetical protein [Balneolaceae bacterium]